MAGGDVFISYAHEDSAYKEGLVLFLWEHGIPVWADELILRGAEFPEQLEGNIRRSGAFVVLMTEMSMASAWVEREIGWALAADVPVFPLLLAGAPFPRLEAALRYDDVREGEWPPAGWVADLRAAAQAPGSGRSTSLDAVPCPDRLVGRGAEVRALVEELREDSGRAKVIDVVGFAGIGKSALARMAAEVVARSCPGIRWWDGLQPAGTDVPPQFGDERGLLVVDDVDPRRPARSGEDFGRLRSPPGRHTLVFTSRSPVLPAPPGPVAHRVFRLRDLDASQAQRLALSWAGDLGSAGAAEVVAHYGGNPRNLQIALQRSRSSESPDPARDVVPELVPIIGSELDAVDDAQRAVLEVMALAREPQSVGEVEAVLAVTGEGAQVTRSVELLEDAGWLSRFPGPRFGMIPVVGATVARTVVERAGAELRDDELTTIGSRPLVRAWSGEATRTAQREAHVRPLLDGLGNAGEASRRWLSTLTTRADIGPYAVGNLLNIAADAVGEIRDIDLSGRSVRQADLTALTLRSVSFRGARFDEVRFRTALEGIICLAADGTGERVAAGTAEGRIHVFSAVTGRILATYRGHADTVTSLAFAANGRFLASASDDGSVQLWDVRDGATLRTLRDGQRGLFAVALDAAGEIVVAGGAAGDLRVWGRLEKEIRWRQDAGAQIASVALHVPRRVVAAGTKAGIVVVWDLDTGERLRTTDDHGGPVNGLSFEGGGETFVASSSDGRTARRWPTTGGRGAPLPGDLGDAGALVSSRDGELAATCVDGRTVEVWDTATGAQRLALRNPDLRVQPVVLDPHHDLVAAGGDSHAVRCWDLKTGQRRWTARGYSRWIKAVRFTTDSVRLACCSDAERIHVWDVRGGSLEAELAGHAGHIRDLATHPTDANVVFSASDDRTVAVWDIERGEMAESLEAHDAPVWAVAVSPDGALLASGTLAGSIMLWSLHGFRLLAQVAAHEGAVRSLAFDGRGRRLTSAGDDCKARVWDLSGRRLAPGPTCCGHGDRIWCVRFVPGEAGLLVTSSEDETVRVWSSASGREVARGAAHVGPVWAVAPDGAGRQVASGGSDRTLRLWELPGSLARVEPSTEVEEVEAVDLGEPRVLTGHTGWVRSVAFAPDGTLATGSHDGTAAVWDPATGDRRVLPVLQPYEGTDITGAEGITDAERVSLRALGATTTGGARVPSR